MAKASRKSASAVDVAYKCICDAILRGEFSEGEHLTEEKLVSFCNVSRTPVREAVRRLITEGFVVPRKTQGVRVKAWSREEVGEVFKARAMAEGLAASVAARKISVEALGRLEKLVQDLEEVLGTPGKTDSWAEERFLQNNRVFHREVMEAADNYLIGNVVTTLILSPIVLRTLSFYDRARMMQSNEHHRMIVVALQARNPDWADASAQQHILAAHSHYLACIDKA